MISHDKRCLMGTRTDPVECPMCQLIEECDQAMAHRDELLQMCLRGVAVMESTDNSKKSEWIDSATFKTNEVMDWRRQECENCQQWFIQHTALERLCPACKIPS